MELHLGRDFGRGLEEEVLRLAGAWLGAPRPGRRLALAATAATLAAAIVAMAASRGAFAPARFRRRDPLAPDSMCEEAAAAEVAAVAAPVVKAPQPFAEEQADDAKCAEGAPLPTAPEMHKEAVGGAPDAEATKHDNDTSEVPLTLETLSDLVGVRKVGEGTAGDIYRATLRTTGQDVAVKVVHASGVWQRRLVANELATWERFGGDDIVTLFASTVEGQTTYFFMEAADGNLYNLMLAPNAHQVSKGLKVRILVEMMRGLRKLERAGFVHRDVRPQNVLVFGDCLVEHGCHVKLGDLGHACDYDVLGRSELEAAGTPLYMAPEVWTKRGSMRKIDVWAVGMIAYEMFVGGCPAALLSLDFEKAGKLSEHPFRHYIPEEFDIWKDERFQAFWREDAEIANLIRGMLTKPVWRRLSVRRALSWAHGIAKARGVDVAEQPAVRLDIQKPIAIAAR